MKSDQSISKWIKSLTQISEMILMDEKLDVTTDLILNVLKTHLGAFAAIYLVVDESKKHLMLHSFTRSPLVGRVLKVIPFDVQDIVYPLNDPQKHTLIAKCILQNKIVQGKSLADFFYPVIDSKELFSKLQRIIGLKSCVAAPVRIKGEPVGAFFVVTKKSEFTKDELELLQFYSNMSGITKESHNHISELNKKYEAERQTTSLLAHEIKTPIAIAYNSTHMLRLLVKKYEKKFGSEFKELKEVEVRIKEQLNSLKQLCSSIMNLRESENNLAVSNQVLDIKRFLPHIIHNFKRSAKEKGLSLKCSYETSDDILYGAGAQFEEIFTIVLDNALKYTKEGGVRVKITLDETSLRCSVKDTGIGISEEEKKRIFDLYYRVKKESREGSERGLGLGLYIAKQFLDAVQGKIDVRDNPDGQGTEFSFSVPVYRSLKG